MEYIRTLTKEFEVGQEAKLSIENRSGEVSVRGEDSDKVRVEVVARLWGDNDIEADEQADLIRRGIRQDGNRIAIRTPTLLRPRPIFFFGRGPRVDYQLTVPRSTEAKIISRSGRIEIEHVSGPLDIEGRSGRVSLREIGGDATIIASSGAIQVEAVDGSLTIESRSGGVKVSGCRGDLAVQQRSGSLQVDDVGGSMQAESRSGVTSISDVGGALTLNSRSGTVRYEGPIRAPFDITVVSGSVRLAAEPDSVFMLDAETASGTVRSDFPVRRDAPAGNEGTAPTVRIRAISGSIYVCPR